MKSYPQAAERRTQEIEDLHRQNEVRNVGVPLGDGGEKKFNWASELSTEFIDSNVGKQTMEQRRSNLNPLRPLLAGIFLTAGGLMIAFFWLVFDATATRSNVLNFGLLVDKICGVIVGCAAMTWGMILIRD